MTRVAGKIIWITGASSGIGEALTKTLSGRNNKVIISARRSEVLEKVRSECKDPENITILPLDLAKSDSLATKSREALDTYGGIDILVNNGGISQRGLVRETEMEVYRRILEVNFFGNIALTKEVLPCLRERKGHIVVISSLVGKFSTPFRSGYSASKHALHGFYDALRAEEYGSGIKVSLICPGFVQTNITRVSLTGSGELYNKMDDVIANGMKPEKVAGRIVRAIERDEDEAIFGGREKLGVYLKRFFPKIFSKYIRKAKVK